MATAAYTSKVEEFGRSVQMVAEITLDQCSLDYTTSPCTATDQGDGMRCFRSLLTCQDPANFDREDRVWRFCLNDVPWTDNDVAAFPYLKQFVSVPQEIDPARLFTYPEKLKLRMLRDFDPNEDDGALANTTREGEFWRNMFRRNPYWSGKTVRLLRGFSGLDFADFEQVGPSYRLSRLEWGAAEVTLICESPLADLNRTEIPFAVSDDNTIQDSGGINASVTTVDVLDGSEYPDPADYSRNSIYIRMESEIARVTSKAGNTLTIVRGEFNTVAAPHAAGVAVEHVCCFGTTDADPVNSIDTIRDLMEWAGIDAADVDTDSFDGVKETIWTGDDVVRIVDKRKKVSKLIQEIREPRSVYVFLDRSAKWAASVAAPDVGVRELDDDELVFGETGVIEDDEARVTRVVLLYDPESADADKPSEFRKAAAVVDEDLEGDNVYGDSRDETVMDLWLDPNIAVSRARLLARRILARRVNGEREIPFRLEIVSATDLEVGDQVSLTTHLVTDLLGVPERIPAILSRRVEKGGNLVDYRATDLNYNGRFMRIGPDTMAETYDAATPEDRSYGYWGDADNRVGSTKEIGYVRF